MLAKGHKCSCTRTEVQAPPVAWSQTKGLPGLVAYTGSCPHSPPGLLCCARLASLPGNYCNLFLHGHSTALATLHQAAAARETGMATKVEANEKRCVRHSCFSSRSSRTVIFSLRRALGTHQHILYMSSFSNKHCHWPATESHECIWTALRFHMLNTTRYNRQNNPFCIHADRLLCFWLDAERDMFYTSAIQSVNVMTTDRPDGTTGALRGDQEDARVKRFYDAARSKNRQDSVKKTHTHPRSVFIF